MRILVVEDEQKVADALREGLEDERYDVVVERTGEGAFFRVNTETFDVVLLDLTLPGRDGLEILRALRQRRMETPVLVLTARDSLEDRVTGLDAAQTTTWSSHSRSPNCSRASARWSGAGAWPMRRGWRSAIWRWISSRARCCAAGKPVDLTVREFELLEFLMRYQGQVVSRETLARDVWKETARTTPLDNVIDVHIARLRRKVDLEHGGQVDPHRTRRRLHAARGRAVTDKAGWPDAGGDRTACACG